MKIILLQSVRGLGDPGDVVNVKSGYARNYLIPKEVAVFATQSNIRQTENRIAKAKENFNIILYTGKVIETYAKLDKNIKIKKFITYKKQNNLIRLFTWFIFFYKL